MVSANTVLIREQAEQVTVGDYTTKHFDICPSAVKLYSNISGKTEMTHLIVETMMLQDLLFRLEKQLIAQGSADEEDVEKAEHYGDMIMDNAEQMDLYDEHSYIEDVHLAKIRQLAGEEDEEDDEDEEDEDEMNEKTLTPAELKKREEIAKAMERENPGMDMSKKMAIATAQAKKVAEGVELAEMFGKVHPTLKQELGAHGDHATGMASSDKGVAVQFDRPKNTSELMKQMSKHGYKSVTSVGSHKNTYHFNEEISSSEMKGYGPGHIGAIQKMLDKEREAKKAKAAMKKENVELDEVLKDDEQTVHKMLNSHSAENLLKAHKKLYGKEYPGTSKSELVSKIKSKVRNYKHAYELMKEEVEQIDELSKDTLRSYRSAALYRNKSDFDDLGLERQRAITKYGHNHSSAAYDLDKSIKRRGKYINLATKKMNTKNEEVEQVDEVSSELAQSTYKKRMDQASAALKRDDYAGMRKAEKKAGATHLRMIKKILRREEVEQIDEVSDKLKQRYINRAMGDHQHANAVRKDAESTGKTDLAAQMKARMKKRNQGMTRAFGGERD